jgi:hypothetical protein
MSYPIMGRYEIAAVIKPEYRKRIVQTLPSATGLLGLAGDEIPLS